MSRNVCFSCPVVIQVCFLIVFMPVSVFALPYQERGVIVVNAENTAPMSFVDVDGQPQGFLIDYWKVWSQKTGVPVSFQTAPWGETLELVKTGRADIHGGLFFIAERDEYLDFSQSFFAVEGALFIRKELDMDADAALRTLLIGVLDKGYGQYYLGKHYPDTEIRKYHSSQDLVAAVHEGKIDGFLTDYPSMLYGLRQEGKADELKVVRVMYQRPIHAAVAEGNAELLALVNLGISAISSVENHNLIHRWFVPESKNWTWQQWTAMSAAGIFIAACVMFLGGRFFFRSGSDD